MRIIDDEVYLNATEAIKHLGIGRSTFYGRYLSQLKAYKFGQLEQRHYKQSELDTLNQVRQAEEQENLSRSAVLVARYEVCSQADQAVKQTSPSL